MKQNKKLKETPSCSKCTSPGCAEPSRCKKQYQIFLQHFSDETACQMAYDSYCGGGPKKK